MLAIRSAIQNIDMFQNDLYLSINVSPEYILNGSVAALLHDVPYERIVIEVTEHSIVLDYPDFSKACNDLRSHGIRLAIDDVGAGYSSFRHILELDPDIIKLDLSITRNIDSDNKRYAFATSVCAFAKAIACEVIAEGVETLEELHVLKDLGIDKAQGYFIGKPMEAKSASCFPDAGLIHAHQQK